MKKLSVESMQECSGGNAISGFCAGLGGARVGIALWNSAVAAGIVAGGAVATGGTLVLAVATACAGYGLGKYFDLW